MFDSYLFWSAVGTAAYLLLSPRMAEPLYRPLMFEPDRFPSGNYDLDLYATKPRDVFFPSLNGQTLHAWHWCNDKADKTILVCHGNQGNISDLNKLAMMLLRLGSSVFVFDYQGYGKSNGKPSFKGICDDAIAAYDWLLKHNYAKARDIVLYGESLGAAVACQLLRQRTVAGIILQSAFCNLRRISMEVFPIFAIFPSLLFPRPYYDNIRALQASRVPLLLIHGYKDTTVSSAHARALFASATEPKELLLLKNTAHEEIDDADTATVLKTIDNFLKCLSRPESLQVA